LTGGAAASPAEETVTYWPLRLLSFWIETTPPAVGNTVPEKVTTEPDWMREWLTPSLTL